MTLVGIFVACAFGAPVPEDVALLSAGLLVSRGALQVAVVFPVALSAIAVGDALPFLLGRLMGPRIFERPFLQAFASAERRERVARRLRRWGPLSCFGARFLPGARIPMYAVAGASGVSPLVFLSLDAVAAAVSVSFWLFVGRGIGWRLPESFVGYLPAFGICAALAVASGFAFRALRRRQRRRDDAATAGGCQPE